MPNGKRRRKAVSVMTVEIDPRNESGIEDREVRMKSTEDAMTVRERYALSHLKESTFFSK